MTSPTPTQTVDDIRAKAASIRPGDNVTTQKFTIAGGLFCIAMSDLLPVLDEFDRMRERLDAGPHGEDAIDVLESAMRHVQAEADRMRERIAALEAENANLKAGIKRLSDEEELINETGRDDMLSVVHISARLAEAEQLARALEAERDRIADANHRQAYCLHLTAQALGPDYSATIEGLPKAAAHVAGQLSEARKVLEATDAKTDRIAAIIKANLYHQHEKIEDAKAIAIEIREDTRAFLAKEK